MPFVIDASVIACWFLPDEADRIADTAFKRLQVDSALMPAVWWFEIRNILLMAERRGRVTTTQVTSVLAALNKLPIAIDRDPSEAEIYTIARTYRLTVYDAASLELARRTSLPLATLDRALATAAGAETVTLVGPGLPS